MTKPKLKIQELNIQEIQIKSLNKSEFCVKEDYEDFQKLFKKSFSDYKQIEPIVLMRDGEIYYIIQGLNRYKAMKAQGIESIQAFVYEDISKDEAKRMRIDSKIVRKKETIFEKAKLYRDRREMFQKDQRNYFAVNPENIDISSFTQESEELSGYSKRYIQQLIKIDKDIYNSVKQTILEDKSDLKYKLTRLIELSRIENEEEQMQKAKALIDEDKGKNPEGNQVVIQESTSDSNSSTISRKVKDSGNSKCRGETYQVNLSMGKVFHEGIRKWLEMTEDYKKKFKELYQEALEKGIKPKEQEKIKELEETA